MTIDPAQLLRRLEPAVRFSRAPAPSGHPTAPFEARGFDDLLAAADGGRLETGRPVEVDADADLAEPIERDRLERFGAAADRAAAAGAERAVLLTEGRALVLDVAARRITGELGRGDDLVRLDAAIAVPSDDDALPQALLPFPGGVPASAVARALADTDSPSTPPTRRAG